MKIRAAAMIYVLAAVFAGCGGGAATSSSTAATGAPNCSSLPPPGLPIMAWPASGATNVPVNIGTLLFEVLDPWPPSGIRVTDSAGANIAVTPTSVPSPLPTGVPSNIPEEAIAVPTLSVATTYSVYQIASASESCGSAKYGLGSFRTQ